LDQLESLQNRLDTSILAQEAMASENRKQRQFIEDLREQSKKAEQRKRDLEIAHEKILQQLQQKLAKTNSSLEKNETAVQRG